MVFVMAGSLVEESSTLPGQEVGQAVRNRVDNDKIEHPENEVDYREQGGPKLKLLWSKGDPLVGQTLYLGGEEGSDGKLYCIPGHAPRVLAIDPSTDEVYPIGDPITSNGSKFKWLRGIPVGDVIYGLPCHASDILRIHVPSQTVAKIPIPYEDFYDDPVEAKQQKELFWKYHGGSVSPIDNCIYAIPQSAHHVVKIDPATDQVSLVGPRLEGKYKWYGGVIGKQDGALYGIPQNATGVLRITPSSVTIHGDYGNGGHKWHGAAAAGNGVIVCVPSNAESVLCIVPGDPEPTLHCIGHDAIQSTRYFRTDRNYKYLGAMAGTNGRVYVFPSGSEYVLQVDTEKMEAKNIGPSLFQTGMERIGQNKWQNGLTCKQDKCVYAIPLAGESLLRIDCSKDGEDPEVTTWPLPAPHRGREKWEGGMITKNGIMYTVPNNHKCVLRIESAKAHGNGIASKDTPGKRSKKHIRDERECSGKNDERLIYKSGIPTLRSSAHRVKYSVKDRRHDPEPLDQDGKPTKTTWLPQSLLCEDVFSFDVEKYDFCNVVKRMLQSCDRDIVGDFAGPKLEDFRVPPPSTWRKVNGGKVEDAQRYLSSKVASHKEFLSLFDIFVTQVALPYVKERLIEAGCADIPTTFYYQRPPTLRIQPGPGWASVKPHNDAEYGHQNGEINFWVPLTDRGLTGVDLWSESKCDSDDYHPIQAKIGEVIAFHGSSCKHYVNPNGSNNTRVSLDFRVGVQGFFDPYWQMKGTSDDHGRQERVI